MHAVPGGYLQCNNRCIPWIRLRTVCCRYLQLCGLVCVHSMCTGNLQCRGCECVHNVCCGYIPCFARRVIECGLPIV